MEEVMSFSCGEHIEICFHTGATGKLTLGNVGFRNLAMFLAMRTWVGFDSIFLELMGEVGITVGSVVVSDGPVNKMGPGAWVDPSAQST